MMLLPLHNTAAEALLALGPPTPRAATVAPAKSAARAPVPADFFFPKPNIDSPWIVSPQLIPRDWMAILSLFGRRYVNLQGTACELLATRSLQRVLAEASDAKPP